MMRLLVLFTVSAIIALRAACVPVRSGKITAGDLAKVETIFAGVPPNTVIALAPAPGARRLFSVMELSRIAERNHISPPAQEICVEYPTAVLTNETVLRALTSAVGLDSAKIDLIDFSRYPVPEGTMSFPRSGLHAPPNATADSVALWQGRVSYGNGRFATVWARVRLSTIEPRVIATVDLAAGKPIEASQVRVQPTRVFAAAPAAPDLEMVVGRVPRRSIPAGQWIAAGVLQVKRDVIRGDRVSVRVETENAQLQFEATAETGGSRGETVFVKNPFNGRRFRGHVDGEKRVLVSAGDR